MMRLNEFRNVLTTMLCENHVAYTHSNLQDLVRTDRHVQAHLLDLLYMHVRSNQWCFNSLRQNNNVFMIVYAFVS